MISIITPCLNIYKDNRFEYFEKMMSSVHNQTWTDLEHIVIDGASTDGTIEILKKYQNKGWIDYLISESDRGIYAAMNKGLKLAKGDFILIMNTDDFFLDLRYLEKSINILQTKKYDFVHADKIIKSRIGRKDCIKKGNQNNAFFRMPFRHQTMLVERSLYKEIGFYDEGYEIASDYKFVLEILINDKKGYYFDEIVLASLDGGASSNREKCIQEVSSVIYEIYGQKNNLTLSECSMIYQQKISNQLKNKILSNIKNEEIINSLRSIF